MVKFKDFLMPLSVFQVLFKANFVSRTFQDSPVYSSTLQACANPLYVKIYIYGSPIRATWPEGQRLTLTFGAYL